MNEQQLQNLRLTFVMKYLDQTGKWPNTDEIESLVQYVAGPKPSAILPAKVIETGAGKAIVA